MATIYEVLSVLTQSINCSVQISSSSSSSSKDGDDDDDDRGGGYDDDDVAGMRLCYNKLQ